MGGFFVPHDLKAPLVGAAQGPLAGLTCAVKDMVAIAGERSGGGNPDWLAQAAPAVATCSAVRKLLDGGATIIGKTVCDEFFYSVAGVNAHYGTPSNLRAPGRIPGGSSSGSAAAVAAGVCDIALGSDTAGSVRIPAALCGVYGLRTTHERIATDGVMAMAPSFDALGWFAASAGLLRNVGTVMLGAGGVAAKPQRLLIAEDAFAQAEPAVGALLKDALAAMAGALPKPETVTLAPQGFDGWREALRIVQAHEIWKIYGDFVARKKPKLGPGVAERMAAAAAVTEAQAEAARKTHHEVRAHIRALLPPGTVIALPAAPSIAPRIDASASELDDFRTRVMRLTCTATLAGVPQISIPVGTVQGCPVALSLMAWPGGDEALLDLAIAVSRFGGFERG